MVIRNVIADQATQMSFIEGNYMVEKFSTAASDPALSNSILPRTLEACPFGFDSARYQKILYVIAEFLVSIKYHIPVGIRVWECLSKLLHYPGTGRMLCHVEMKDLASSMFYDKKEVKDSKGDGGHGEEVHGCDNLAMIAQESCPKIPRLVGRRQAQNISRNSAFGDLIPKLQKFTMDSGGTPGGILFHHPPDDSSDLGIDFWSAQALWS